MRSRSLVGLTIYDLPMGSESRLRLDFQDQEERNLLWKARHSVFYATCAQRPNTKCYVTDVCVPISKLPELLATTKDDIDRAGVYGTVVGHVGEWEESEPAWQPRCSDEETLRHFSNRRIPGDGNFHTMLLFDPNDPASFKAVHDLGERMALKAIELDGTCTGEHGIGLGE